MQKLNGHNQRKATISHANQTAWKKLASRCAARGRHSSATHIYNAGRCTRSGASTSPKPSDACGHEKSIAAILSTQKSTGAWQHKPLRQAIFRHIAHLAIEEVKPHHVAAIVAEFRHINPVSRYSYISTLGSWLRRIGCGLATNGMPANPRPGPRERIVSAVEYEAAVRHASAPGALAMLLANEACLRAGAIATLCRHNLDFKQNVMRGKTKAGANYNVPMTPRVRERLLWVAAGAEPEEPLVKSIAYRRTAQTAQTLDHHIRQAKKRAGISTAWTLHDLRRTAARRVYERTKDVRKVQRVLSHKSLATTMWYLGDAGTDVTAEDLQPTNPSTDKEKTA